jgi:6-pyruvoyltetrahydropterin/6-carboxytetrahydropterin synthase
MTSTVEIDGRAAGMYAHIAHFVTGHPVCGALHGHSVSLSIVIEGYLVEPGFVADFTPVKKAMRAILDSIDHKGLMAPARYIEQRGETVVAVHNGDKLYILPSEDVVALEVTETTAEYLAEWALDTFLRDVKLDTSTFRSVTMKYWETASTCGAATWQRK